MFKKWFFVVSLAYTWMPALSPTLCLRHRHASRSWLYFIFQEIIFTSAKMMITIHFYSSQQCWRHFKCWCEMNFIHAYLHPHHYPKTTCGAYYMRRWTWNSVPAPNHITFFNKFIYEQKKKRLHTDLLHQQAESIPGCSSYSAEEHLILKNWAEGYCKKSSFGCTRISQKHEGKKRFVDLQEAG